MTDIARSVCDPEVYQRGKAVFLTHTLPSKALEAWVKEVARDSGQQVDWHWIAGRALVKCLGDWHKVQRSLLKLRPTHDEAFLSVLRASPYYQPHDARQVDGIWDYARDHFWDGRVHK